MLVGPWAGPGRLPGDPVVVVRLSCGGGELLPRLPPRRVEIPAGRPSPMAFDNKRKILRLQLAKSERETPKND